MDKQEICSLGGKISGAISRKKALEKYYENPNICKNCGKVIEVPDGVKVSQIRQKKFCNQSCSAQYSNRHRKRNKFTGYCELCGKELSSKRAKYCNDCRKKYKNDKIKNATKGQLIQDRGRSRARATIAKNARKVFFEENNNEVKCDICGYDKYIEVCHIKPVSDFENNSAISEINNINNLIGLCPNHHKELDNGLLDLSSIDKINKI